MSGAAAAVAGRLRAVPRVLDVRALPARWRRRLLGLGVACLVLALGYQFWLRDSSFVAVDKVSITGLTTSDAERVRVALTAAGRSMTTLHVDHETLERAVAGFPAVRELEVTADFPHGLRIHVIEHVPAAIAVADDGRVAVAGDGTILRGLPVEGRLPTIEIEGSMGVGRLSLPLARDAAAVAGAAPARLRARMAGVVDDGDRGLVAEMRDGPELIFGNATRLHAKWAAASRVLADPEASGASYIDLRIPGRPAAGGLPAETVLPVAPAGVAPLVPQAGTETGEVAAGTVTDPAATATAPAPETAAPAPAPTAAPTPAEPAPEAPAEPAPAAPLTGGTGGGATAAP